MRGSMCCLLLVAMWVASSSALGQRDAAPPARAQRDNRQIEWLWRQVGGEDLAQVRSAVRTLGEGGDRVVAFVRRRIGPALGKADGRDLDETIARLDDDRYSVRESASRQLQFLGRRAGPALRRALRTTKSPEVYARLRELLGRYGGPMPDTPTQRRLVRAVRVLELIGTESARALLRQVRSSDARPYLEYREAGKYVVEAGFVPDKAEYVWGEPIQKLTFVVRNIGEQTVRFAVGGDYRGSGRHERFKITAVDSRGRAVLDPLAGRPNMGGLGTSVRLEPGTTYVQVLPMDKRLRFAGPGAYTLTCKRTLDDDMGAKPRPPGVAIVTTFALTIHPYSRQRMEEVIDDLADQIRAAGRLEPRPMERVMGRSAAVGDGTRLHYAMSALAEIHDEAAVRHLVGWCKSANPNIRSWGLRALGKFPTRQVEALLIDAVRTDAAGHVRSEAARNLASFRTPAVQAALTAALGDAEAGTRAQAALSLGSAGLADPKAAIAALGRALKDKDPGVRTSAAGALGRKLARAAPKAAGDLLLPMLDDGVAAVRREAGVALAMMGDKRVIPKLKQRIEDDPVPLAQMLMRLGEPFDCAWITPVIRARKGNNWQSAIHFVREHGGKRAAAALIRCLDFDKPTADYYNYTLCWQIAAAGGPKVTYHHDHDSDGTDQQQRHNAEALRKLKAWADDSERKPRRE